MSDVQASSELEPAGRGGFALLRPILVASLWRFRWLLVLGVVLGVAFGVFRGLVMPNQFRSTGKLLVRPGALESVSSDSVLSSGALVARAGGSREAVQNVLQALSSPDYYRRVVRRLGLDAILAPYDPAKDENAAFYKQVFHAFQSWWFNESAGGEAPVDGNPERAEAFAALQLQNMLWFVPEAGTSVISLNYISHSPELAKRVVDTALAEAKSFHTDLIRKFTSPEESKGERANAFAAAETAETALRDFLREKKVNDFEKDRERLLEDLADHDGRLVTLKVEIASTTAALAAQRLRLAGLPARRVNAGSQQWVDNPRYVAEQAALGKLREDQRASDRGEGSAEQKRAQRERFERQIKEIEEQLASIRPKVLTEPIEEENPVHARVAEEIGGLEAVLASKTKARDATDAERTSTLNRLAELDAIAPRLRELEAASNQARIYADLFASRESTTSAMQKLDAANLSSVVVMQEGTDDGIKIAPRRGQLVVFGAAGGFAFAVAFVALLALLDRRVRYREDLPRLGLPEGGVLVSGGGGSGMPWMLPSSLAEIRDDIARFWAALPYERRQTQGLRIGFVPCGEAASAGRAAAALALGLAAHGGEKVCYVGTLEGPTWLGQRLGLDHQCGWSEVMRGEFALEDAVVATPVQGLHYLPAGKIGPVVPHPMAGPAFVALLDRLVQTHRFVVVELPDLTLRPEGRSVLGVMDGAQLVVCRTMGSKASVREAIAAVQSAGARLLGGVLQQPATAPATNRASA
jgi:uncharacterized protein involved in exopolysaccharide biosynthesis